MKDKLKKPFKLGIILFTVSLFVVSCQKEFDLLTEEDNLALQGQSKSYQSHLKSKDMPMILDFVNLETNNTRQVLIGKTDIKKLNWITGTL